MTDGARSVAFVAGALPAAALAHGDGAAAAAEWTAWSVTPDIVIGIAIAAALYAAGVWNRHGREPTAPGWRHAAFFSGLAAVFIALQSPLDAAAERSFFMHQLQHLLLQTIGPVLLMLAAPQAVLVAGMPLTLRRGVLAPLLSIRPLRQVFALLTRPWIAVLLVVASLYAWHWPPYHDRAIRDDAVHYLMHFTMLGAGLLFYWCVLDPRPAPLGARYGTRINMLWASMTANVLLGAALALKGTVLYTAYHPDTRPWAMGALADEQLGGLIMWIPGSALCVPVFLAVIRMWGSQEARHDERRRRGLASAAHASGAANRRVALWLALAAFAGFAGTLGIGWLVVGGAARGA